MTIRPKSPAAVFLELIVVHQSKNRLEEEQAKHHDPDHRMIVVEKAHGDVLDEPDPYAKCRDVHYVREELKQSVDEPEPRKGSQPDEDRARGEEDDEGKGREDAVCDEDLLALV